MSDSEQPSPPASRQRFRFSLRWLMILVTLVAMLMAWAALVQKKARHRQAIVNDIERLGYSAGFTHTVAGATPSDTPFAPHTELLNITLDHSVAVPHLSALAQALEDTDGFCVIRLH